MRKILRKRVLRDLKSNCFRYAALALLIVLGMYLVVSIVGAADTVISGVDSMAEKNRLEDGEFNVFVPLAQEQENKINDKGITLERIFYLDYPLKDTSTIRVFKNRKEVNLIEIDQGKPADNFNEAVIEKRYSEEHGLSLGDSIEIGNEAFKIVGIGTVPDYDSMLKSMADSSAESKLFGLAFITDEQYEKLKSSENYTKTEEYTYAYRLNSRMTDNELKDYLGNLDFDIDNIKDPYFKEFWDRTAGKKEDIRNGINKLGDGTEELNDALMALKNNNGNITGGAEEIFKAYLDEIYSRFTEYGYHKKLTGDNYKTVLKGYIDGTDNAVLKLKFSSVLEELNNLNKYSNGIDNYTDAVARSSDGAAELSEGMKKLKSSTDELLDKYFKADVKNLTRFVKAEDNPRIKASSGDQIINKFTGLVAGIIVMILFTYVISVFVVHGIERESRVIGILYALGARKKELVMHYLTLPVGITLIAGICGTLIGFSRYGLDVQIQGCYTYFSIPELNTLYPVYLIIYGVIMPPAVAALVNYFVISSKLSQPALKMIRNEQQNSRVSNINLGNMGFIGRFRIRQMLREARTGFTVIFGMFISLLVMMIGIDCYVMCQNMSVENKADTKYEYMYTFKYPQEQVPDYGEACYAETLSREAYGYNLDVTLLGIDNNNPYFDFNTVKGRNKVVIASSTAQKFNLEKGDKLILEDKADNIDYAFTVDDVVPYSVGLYVFMDIDSMRELLGQEDNYYNVVLSSKKLNIDAGRLFAVTAKNDIIKSSDVFIDKMMPMIIMMIVVSVIIFCVVMYLMMKVMIDRAAFNISLIKVFGYRMSEIRKLYLNGNFYIIAVGAAVCIPLAKKLMDAIYPYLISNVACGMNLAFSWQLYMGIFGGVLLLYFVINRLLVERLKKIIPAEILKNGE
jgi:putative ABC transport system permease protein